MMNVPCGVCSGKSPMNTVWDLISVWRGSSKYGSENVRLMVCAKFSIGEISWNTSSSPETCGTVLVPFASSSSTRFFQRSLPTSQSKLSVCTPRRYGTSMGSLMEPKFTRSEALCRSMSC